MISHMQRSFKRNGDTMRPISITTNVSRHAEGSALVSFGHTKVLCTASVEEDVPHFLKGQNHGWVTAEYNMLPRATHTRNRRANNAGSGRTFEIQRLIGRTLRSITDLRLLGKRQILIDCDVLDADGGTRQAAIAGAYVALVEAIGFVKKTGLAIKDPVLHQIAAVGVGVVGGEILVDLDYQEDSAAQTDATIVLTKTGSVVSFQLSAETEPLPFETYQKFYDKALAASKTVFQAQDAALSL